MESKGTDRETALAALNQERAWWEGTMLDIGENRMESPGIMGTWTPKDLVGHISGWQRKKLDDLHGAIQGDPHPPTHWPAVLNGTDDPDDEGDTEGINQWIHERNRDRPAQDVLAESRAQWDELHAIVESMSDEHLNDPNMFPGLSGQSMAEALTSGSLFGHFHDEHEPDIRAWLDTQDDTMQTGSPHSEPVTGEQTI